MEPGGVDKLGNPKRNLFTLLWTGSKVNAKYSLDRSFLRNKAIKLRLQVSYCNNFEQTIAKTVSAACRQSITIIRYVFSTAYELVRRLNYLWEFYEVKLDGGWKNNRKTIVYDCFSLIHFRMRKGLKCMRLRRGRSCIDSFADGKFVWNPQIGLEWSKATIRCGVSCSECFRQALSSFTAITLLLQQVFSLTEQPKYHGFGKYSTLQFNSKKLRSQTSSCKHHNTYFILKANQYHEAP